MRKKVQLDVMLNDPDMMLFVGCIMAMKNPITVNIPILYTTSTGANIRTPYQCWLCDSPVALKYCVIIMTTDNSRVLD